MVKMKQLESKLQAECVKWFRLQHPDKIIFAIPNGGSRNVMEAANLKRSGVLSGVSDLFIAEPSMMDVNIGSEKSSIYVPKFVQYHGMFIEMKYGKNKLQESQKIFSESVIKKGYYFVTCYSFDDFKKRLNNIENYLKTN